MMDFYKHYGVLILVFCNFVNGKGFWSSSGASYSSVIQDAFPVGNGRLGGLPFTVSPGTEKVSLNVDSLWSGGPFQTEVSACIIKFKSLTKMNKRATLVEIQTSV